MISNYAEFIIKYLVENKNIFMLELDKDLNVLEMTKALKVYIESVYNNSIELKNLKVDIIDNDKAGDREIAFILDEMRTNAFKFMCETMNGNRLIIIETPDDYTAVLSRMSQMNMEILDLMRVVNKKNLQIKELIYKDVLTGLFNRRYVYEIFKKIKQKSTDKNYNEIYLCMIDIDDFKGVNDNFGHEVGDQVLSLFGDEIMKTVSDDDIAARLGGDEFVIIYVNKPLKTVYDKLSFIKLNYDQEVFKTFDFHITLSIGISKYQNEEKLSFWLNKGDVALYDAKNKGKNKTILLDLNELEE